MRERDIVRIVQYYQRITSTHISYDNSMGRFVFGFGALLAGLFSVQAV